MFLRFGFILGQGGVLGMMAMLIISYIINLITTLSVSAISSNGTVRGGGAYYLISRSLGPEFGGSIGLVFYLGFVFNTGMNAVGLVDCIVNNFGELSGTVTGGIPESYWYRYLYGTVVLLVCTGVCLLGSGMFSRASTMLLVILLVATFSIPISALFVGPFEDTSGIVYTGISMDTLKENLMPRFTKGAAGSDSKEKENWQNLFGILFPATAGIFAGASMSGDLRNPSKSIPKGTLHGLLFTFVAYTLVILAMGATISRETLYTNTNVIQGINASPPIILMGEFATSFFSALMGVIGSAKSLQALARDNIFPGLSIFGQGTKSSDDPTYAIFFTFLLSQLTLFMNINSIASFVTMTYLITFWVTNFACFLLKIGSAPNFRPTFKFFTWWTAAVGALISVATMFFVDGTYASGVIGMILFLFLIIHYFTPPKPWGDVSQSLIYHQVRKYLLRLRTEHVKFWRPQILLLVNDPRRSWKLIQFCNAMKKGGLYILGHIVVTAEFQDSFQEVKRQQSAWMKYIDFSRIKAFPQVSIAPTVEWGARNIVLSAGLGGMRPNITVMGFFNIQEYRDSRPLIDLNTPGSSLSKSGAHRQRKQRHDLQDQLPTDSMRPESAVDPKSYVNILEDLLLCLQMNVAVAKGFEDLELPSEASEKKYIDLWPIQMSAEIQDDTSGNITTTNFDTYTLILQLGCILNTVRTWKKAYKLRIIVFVEYETDVAEESDRVKKLLENLRIQADVIVAWLANGSLRTYEIIVNGADPGIPGDERIERILGQEAWWSELRDRRRNPQDDTPAVQIRGVNELMGDGMWPGSSFQQLGRTDSSPMHRLGLKRLRKATKRHSISGLAMMGLSVSFNMRTQRLNPDALLGGSASEESSDDESSVVSSAASENDADEFDDDDRIAWNLGRPRRASAGAALTSRETQTLRQKADSMKFTSEAPTAPSTFPTTSLITAPTAIPATAPTAGDPALLGAKLNPSLARLKLISRPSSPSFSSRAIPDTQLAVDDGPGPSIRFATPDSPVPVPAGNVESPIGAIPALSFNDLPSRGQHLILNELMQRYSVDTAVLFTTLPSPPPNSCKNEQESMSYLEGLELLTEDLPPTLLVHSNSLCVTTSL
ncbi:amino acid permease-domain-containing protein [Tricharina praecox]|uniref:amino acid permease-domain-containing protein n=1 Tax=Tricharina praecox TaxID=43433 RepID=UPI00222007D0|nr:amino acid permease-domain-containing protein [Tricharina praecox]KAI5849973.1 amino acid permease-domain-containing protein [Tricharina praecox]